MKPSHPFLRLLSLMLCLSLCLFAAGCGGSGAAASGSSANAQGSAGGSSAASESQAAGGLPVALQTLTDYGFDYAEEFRNGYAFAVRGNECGYIDSSGNFTVYYHIGDSPYLASIEMSESSFSSSDHMQMWVSEEGLFPWYDENTQQWGYGNIHTGEMVIPALYNAACPFSEGRAVVRWVQEYHSDTPGVNAVGVEPMCQIIDTDGNVICDLSSAFEIAFEGGVLLASLKDGGGGVIDRDGNLIFETELWFSGPAGGLHNLSSTYAELSRSTDPEIITVQSPVVIQTGDAIYDGLKTTYIDRTGAVICTPPEGSTFSYRWNDGAKTALYVADDGSGCGILDQTGVLTEPLFDRFYFPHGGVMIAKPMGLSTGISTPNTASGWAVRRSMAVPTTVIAAWCLPAKMKNGVTSIQPTVRLPFPTSTAAPWHSAMALLRLIPTAAASTPTSTPTTPCFRAACTPNTTIPPRRVSISFTTKAAGGMPTQ